MELDDIDTVAITCMLYKRNKKKKKTQNSTLGSLCESKKSSKKTISYIFYDVKGLYPEEFFKYYRISLHTTGNGKKV